MNFFFKSKSYHELVFVIDSSYHIASSKSYMFISFLWVRIAMR